MKVIVIGATGTIGRAVVELLQGSHEVVRASRGGDPPGSAGGALVNAGVEAFVQAAQLDLSRGLRINAVSPGWVAETLVELGMDPAEGVPAGEVARAYVDAVEGGMQGEVLRPGASATRG